MRVEGYGGPILTQKTKELGEKPVPVPFCPPKIPHGLNPGAYPDLRCETPANNRLRYGMTNWYMKIVLNEF
jgi:hypothetical protein